MTSPKGGLDLTTSNAVWKSGMPNISESMVFFVETADLFTSFEVKYPGAARSCTLVRTQQVENIVVLVFASF